MNPISTFGLLAPALAAGILLGGSALAQPAAPPASTSAEPSGPRVERITHEDALARVDEVRVGGETKSIEVQPKTALPGYQITPVQGGENRSDGWGQRGGSSGKSSWRVLNF